MVEKASVVSQIQHMGKTATDGRISVVVHESLDPRRTFVWIVNTQDSLVVRYPGNGLMSWEPLDPAVELLGTEPTFRLPSVMGTDVGAVLAQALLGREPATDRLTNKLEELLTREQDRVDKLIESLTDD